MIRLCLKLGHVSFSEAIIVVETFTETLSRVIGLSVYPYLSIVPLNYCELVELFAIVRSNILTVSLRVLFFIFIYFLVEIENCHDLQEPK